MGKKSYNFILNEPRKNYRYRSISFEFGNFYLSFIIYDTFDIKLVIVIRENEIQKIRDNKLNFVRMKT